MRICTLWYDGGAASVALSFLGCGNLHRGWDLGWGDICSGISTGYSFLLWNLPLKEAADVSRRSPRSQSNKEPEESYKADKRQVPLK